MKKVSIFHSKWKKAIKLARHPKFRRYAPQTAKLSRVKLSSFLKRYGEVYIKPNLGRHGYGVIKTTRKIRNRKVLYTFQREMTRKKFYSLDALYRTVKRHTGWDTFLVQKGVRSLTLRGRPFDIRVMVQKNPQGRWETTGKIGRLAHPKKIVTNYNLGRNGGTPTPVDKLLSPLMSKKQKSRIHARLDRLGYDMAKYLQRSGYPRTKAIGLDVMIDRSLKPWIIEVNTANPNPYLFRHARNKVMFGKILRYYRFQRRSIRRK